VGLPEQWTVGLQIFNIYEAAYFGAEIDFSEGQVPDTKPPYRDEDRKEDVFDIPIENPLENPFVKDRLAFWHEMNAVCRDLRFEGRPVVLGPWVLTGTDGPLTVACNLRGADFLMDLVSEPEYADRLLSFIMDATLSRRRAFEAYWGDRVPAAQAYWMADDSVAMVSGDMYRERILPVHRRYFADLDAAQAPFAMHMCGDATRHFPLIARELGVTIFDTGFPVDHGALRRTLGPDIEIKGGPEVSILHGGTPEANYQRAREILESGIKDGGRFVLRDGNNLPACCPLENLNAAYQACLDYGRYTS
jgi:uroporphyrinogen-III decarboxylase